MGFFKKILKPFKSVVDTAFDFVTDTGKAIMNVVTGAFTGGFGIPDIDFPDSSADVNQSLTINYNSSNSPIPVIYGRKVDCTVIPVHIKTWGPNNEFLTVVGAISTGLSQTLSTGSWVFNIEIDNESVGALYATTAYTSSPFDQLDATGYPYLNNDTSIRPVTTMYNSGSNLSAAQIQFQPNPDGNFPLAGGFDGRQPMVYAPSFGRYAARFKAQFFDGSDSQPVSSLAQQADSTWNERLPGIRYGVFQFHLYNESFGDQLKVQYKNSYNGLPQIKLMVDGRNIPDIVSRPQAADTLAVDQWDTVFASGYQHQGTHNNYAAGYSPTTNPVLHLLDFMMNSHYGAGIPLAQFDKDSWVRAAKVPRVYKNYGTKTGLTGLMGLLYKLLNPYVAPSGSLLEQVDGIIYNVTRNLLTPSDTDEQSYTPYNSSGAIEFANNPYNRQFKIYPDRSYLENINLMLRSMGAILTYRGGKYHLLMENAGDEENSYVIPTVGDLKTACDAGARTFTDDNLVGSISIKGAALENTFNQIKLNYPDLADKSKSNSQIYPDDGSLLSGTYLEEDNGQKLTAEITNTGIFTPLDALIYAKVTLNKSRNRETISFVTNDSATNIVPGDIIRVNSSLANIDNLYRVTDFLITESGQIELSGIRHIPDNYDFEVDSLFDRIRKLARERQPVVQRQPVSIQSPTQLSVSKVKREDDFFDLSLNTTDIVISWRDPSKTAGTNTYQISIEAVGQNNQTFGTRILGETSSLSYKIRADEIPPGANIIIGVRTKTPSGALSSKTLVTGNNTPTYDTPLNNTIIPWESDFWSQQASLSSGGAVAGTTTNDAGNTGEGEL